MFSHATHNPTHLAYAPGVVDPRGPEYGTADLRDVVCHPSWRVRDARPHPVRIPQTVHDRPDAVDLLARGAWVAEGVEPPAVPGVGPDAVLYRLGYACFRRILRLRDGMGGFQRVGAYTPGGPFAPTAARVLTGYAPYRMTTDGQDGWRVDS